MTRNPMTQKVNFYVSVCFIGCFSLLMITTVFNIAHYDNPIVDAAAAAQNIQVDDN